MIELEYILALYDMPHTDLAKKLDISRQNINQWIKGKIKIPEKHLPTLSKIFNMPEEIFPKELTDIDKINILKQVVIKYCSITTIILIY